MLATNPWVGGTPCPHFIDEDTEAPRGSTLPKLVIGMQAQACPSPLPTTLGWLPRQLLSESGLKGSAERKRAFRLRLVFGPWRSSWNLRANVH